MRNRLIALGCLLAIVASMFGWYRLMEKRSVAVPWESPERGRDVHLLARRLLERSGSPVTGIRTPGLALDAAGPQDLLLMPRRSAPLDPSERDRLLAWVERGGMLVTTHRPRYEERRTFADSLLVGLGAVDEIEENEDSAVDEDEDPSGAESSADSVPVVDSAAWDSVGSEVDEEPDTAWIGLPGLGYRLRVWDYGFPALVVDPSRNEIEWIDSSSRLVVIRKGRGRIVVCGSLDWIQTETLSRQDHAQLLLGLCQWRGSIRRVLLVDSLEVPPWYRWLWSHAWSLVLGAVFLLVLRLWHGMVRREPLLPPPDPQRRSLREHVEASGQWWWSCEDGPETLLQRVREEAKERLLLRYPSVSRLPLSEQLMELARLLEIDPETLRLALGEPVGREPAAFTRTLRLLQELEDRR